MVWTSISPSGSKSVKQNTPIMAANTAYIETTQKVDHFFYDSGSKDGHHRYAQMAKYGGATPADPTVAAGMDLVYYAKKKTAAEATAQQDVQAFIRNGTNVMQMLGIRAMAVINVAGGVVTTVYKHNVTTVSRVSTGLYKMSFTSNAPSVNYLAMGGGMRGNTDPNAGVTVSVASSAAIGNIKKVGECTMMTTAASGDKVDPIQCWFIIFGG